MNGLTILPVPHKGCQANKPLMCKTWLCSAKSVRHPEIEQKLYRVRKIAGTYDFIHFREDKDTSMKIAMMYITTHKQVDERIALAKQRDKEFEEVREELERWRKYKAQVLAYEERQTVTTSA